MRGATLGGAPAEGTQYRVDDRPSEAWHGRLHDGADAEPLRLAVR